MAQFYAEIRGSRGEASRLGTKSSGIRGHVRGWNSGASVECRVTTEDDTEREIDQTIVAVTSGSNGGDAERTIATIDDTGSGRRVRLFNPVTGDELFSAVL